MSAKHTTIRLLSELLDRKEWGKSKEHHILASNSARASLTNQLPFSSLFPFPFPSPFHTNSLFHHSSPHPQIRKRWLTLHASKQASKQSKRHVVSEDFEIFSLVQPNLQVIYLQIYLPTSAEK